MYRINIRPNRRIHRFDLVHFFAAVAGEAYLAAARHGHQPAAVRLPPPVALIVVLRVRREQLLRPRALPGHTLDCNGNALIARVLAATAAADEDDAADAAAAAAAAAAEAAAEASGRLDVC